MSKSKQSQNTWTEIDNRFIDHGIQELSSGAAILYVILARHCFGKKDYCRPGQARLAEMAGTSIPTVRRWLTELREKGFIDRDIFGGLNETRHRKTHTNQYTLKTNRSNMSGSDSSNRSNMSGSNRSNMSGSHATNRSNLISKNNSEEKTTKATLNNNKAVAAIRGFNEIMIRGSERNCPNMGITKGNGTIKMVSDLEAVGISGEIHGLPEASVFLAYLWKHQFYAARVHGSKATADDFRIQLGRLISGVAGLTDLYTSKRYQEIREKLISEYTACSESIEALEREQTPEAAAEIEVERAYMDFQFGNFLSEAQDGPGQSSNQVVVGGSYQGDPKRLRKPTVPTEETVSKDQIVDGLKGIKKQNRNGGKRDEQTSEVSNR